MIVTEQAAFLDGRDSPDSRRAGLDEMFDALADHLAARDDEQETT